MKLNYKYYLLTYIAIVLMLITSTALAESPDIKANGSDGPVTIAEGSNLNVECSLEPGSHTGENADWWIWAESPFGKYWYTLNSGWQPSNTPIRVHGGPLFNLSPYSVLNMSALPVGDYGFNFAVDDNMDNIQDNTYADLVLVTIGNGSTNTPPAANAGPDQNVTTGSLVTLDGSGSSDADGNILTYSWSFTSVPTGSGASLSDATVANPTFTADVDGSYVLSLTVNDGTVDSATDTVLIAAVTDTGPSPTDTVAYATAMVPGAWTFIGWGCSPQPDPTINGNYFICPGGGIRGGERSISVSQGFDYDYYAEGSWSISNTTGADYASLILDYTTSINIGGSVDTGPGLLGSSEGRMLYDSQNDNIVYWYNSCWHYLGRLEDGAPSDVDDSYCGSSSSGSGDQCGTDSDCGRCWYCDKSGSTNTCRYGGEGPFGCYRGWDPP